MVMVFTLFIVTYAHSIRQNPNNMIVFEKKKNNQKIRNLSCSFIKLKTRLLEHWNYYLQSLFKLPCPNSPIHHHICVYMNIFFLLFRNFQWHIFNEFLLASLHQTAGWISSGNSASRSGNFGNGRQNENARRTASSRCKFRTNRWKKCTERWFVLNVIFL